MKKTDVTRGQQDDQVPFFRGILIKSLVNIEIPFDDAYELANRVREDLRDVAKISSDDLAKRVGKLVEERFGKDKRDRYDLMHRQDARILVQSKDSRDCFSLGHLRHSLKACAIPADTAAAAALQVQDTLHAEGNRLVNRQDLRRIVYHCLKDHFSHLAANRYLSWRQFKDSGTPLVMLIGGPPGVGKSSIAAELAYRLHVARIQSTDLMREIIRSYLTPAVAPTLQYSSFEAWQGLLLPRTREEGKGDGRVVEGFLSQVATMRPALVAAIDRAVQERESLIMEGVHVLPGELDLSQINDRAVVISLVLAANKKGTLRGRLHRRFEEAEERNPSRYIEHLNDIWELQSFIVANAEAADITVLPTANIETTIGEMLDLAAKVIMQRCPPQPELLIKQE